MALAYILATRTSQLRAPRGQDDGRCKRNLLPLRNGNGRWKRVRKHVPGLPGATSGSVVWTGVFESRTVRVEPGVRKSRRSLVKTWPRPNTGSGPQRVTIAFGACKYAELWRRP